MAEIVENWWRKARQRNMNRYKGLYRNLKFNVRNSILDIGGGAGTFLKYIGVNDATIIDVGGKKSLIGNYKFIEADITEKLPNLRKKFKTIFVMEVLEHIKNPLYLMAQVYDLLDKDGICYVAVPYTPLDTERRKGGNPFNCHVCRWKLKELVSQMQKLGFLVNIIQKRRRFKNTAFYLPHCWIVLALKKRMEH